MKTIDKLRKFAEGGKVRKFDGGGSLEERIAAYIKAGKSPEEARKYAEYDMHTERVSKNMGIATDAVSSILGDSAGNAMSGVSSAFSNINSGEWNPDNRITNKNGEDITEKVGKGLAIGAGVLSSGVLIADDLAMGDKNFGAQSEAIDGAVHAASSALMLSGNPYAMAAGAALEGANFLTKAGGQTVQGFDVDINSSGYGDMGHMESSSSRSLFGIGNGNVRQKLQKRNDQMRRAMDAANIANEQSFEQEARMNSVQNTIMNNQIALAGGMDTSLLGG